MQFKFPFYESVSLNISNRATLRLPIMFNEHTKVLEFLVTRTEGDKITQRMCSVPFNAKKFRSSYNEISSVACLVAHAVVESEEVYNAENGIRFPVQKDITSILLSKMISAFAKSIILPNFYPQPLMCYFILPFHKNHLVKGSIFTSHDQVLVDACIITEGSFLSSSLDPEKDPLWNSRLKDSSIVSVRKSVSLCMKETVPVGGGSRGETDRPQVFFQRVNCLVTDTSLPFVFWRIRDVAHFVLCDLFTKARQNMGISSDEKAGPEKEALNRLLDFYHPMDASFRTWEATVYFDAREHQASPQKKRKRKDSENSNSSLPRKKKDVEEVVKVAKVLESMAATPASVTIKE